MIHKKHLAAAGRLAVASFVLVTAGLAYAPAEDPALAVTAFQRVAHTGSVTHGPSIEESAALMEREAAKWEGPVNVDEGRTPGSAAHE